MRSADREEDRLCSETKTTMHPSKRSTRARVIVDNSWITFAKTVEAVAAELRSKDNLVIDLSKLKM